VHPSTLQILYELGILDDFLKRPHQKVHQVRAEFEGESAIIADLSHLPTAAKYVAFMPQWEFLDFIAGVSRRYPSFELRMQAEAVELLRENGRITGVRANTPDGPLEVQAGLIVAADGRQSLLRAKADLPVRDLGAPIDVLWFRVTRRSNDGEQVLGRASRGKMIVMLNRGEYWQCAYLIRKGDLARIQARGIQSFRNDIAAVSPSIGDRVAEIGDWDHIKLLTVKVDRLLQWCREGFLCIGDAAHAMSPMGGVGINIAIQDAVAAANVLSTPLRQGTVTLSDLQRVQRRRELPVRLTQAIQVFLQNRLVRNTLGSDRPVNMPLPVKLLNWWPFLRRIPARIVGIGFRPEHVSTPPFIDIQLPDSQRRRS
jgi:2-polyprenyl-6-methoxyphenol hydroxylase-like FAD-dependent oxidoreductase